MLHRQDVAPRFQDDPVARPSGSLAFRLFESLALVPVLTGKSEVAGLSNGRG